MMKWTFNDIDFTQYPVYKGDDLGVYWTHEKTIARIWAPTAKKVLFKLFNDGATGSSVEEISMEKSEQGTWIAILPGDRDGFFYTIQVCDEDGWFNECPDIYAKATGINGLRGMIINPEKSNPPNWIKDKRCTAKNPCDMVIYEIHVRDFSISPDSGIENKGKYIGVTETGRKLSTGESTGIDHLTELGITHVHLLPIADFYTVDESQKHPQYNWGYDPLNYNTPEGSYSTDAANGYIRIRELKEMIKALHDRKIGVILDVVYNHTGLIFDSWFNQTVPGYFYRLRGDGTFSDASGCGTEIASEREMVRRYIIDSVAYWAEEYHIDGFRFDLMGIIDIETMNLIRKWLDEIDPDIFMYGEGWAAGDSPLPAHLRAVKLNTPQLDRIASFSDDIRDGLKGTPFDRYSTGFISGLTLREEKVKFSMAGAIEHGQIVNHFVDSSRQSWAKHPGQCINYVTCHDNYTLFDKLQYSCPEASLETLERITKLAIAILLTSQGVPFLHAGVEMHRTKGGHHDSYRSSDEVNQIDWSRKAVYPELFDFTKKCIELRRQHPAFRMNDADMVREKQRFYNNYVPGLIVYELCDHANSDQWKRILLLFNGNNYSVEYAIPKERWMIIAQNGEIYLNGIGHITSDKVRLHPISMMMLAVVC
jgi:pullulanase